MSKKDSMELVACSLYQLVKQGNGFDTDLSRAKCIRPLCKVPRGYFDDTNAYSDYSGRVYVEDKELTKSLAIKRAELLKERLEKDAIAKKSPTQALTESLEKIIQKTEKPTKGRKGGADVE